jgi:hypothetical protein
MMTARYVGRAVEPQTRPSSALLDARTLRTVVIALGVFHLLEGGWELLWPGSFFEEIGRYGVENTHYVGDVGAFTAAYGLALLLAAGRPSWWAPLFAVGALWYGLHAINHLFDIDEARSDARGAIDTILIAIGAALLAWLAVAAERSSRV